MMGKIWEGNEVDDDNDDDIDVILRKAVTQTHGCSILTSGVLPDKALIWGTQCLMTLLKSLQD